MGRPSHRATSTSRRQVEAMAGYGIPVDDIANVLRINAKTLRKHYREELDTGHVKANAKVAENLYRKATGDGRESVIAAIFWLKTRARWKEVTVNEISHDLSDPLKQMMERIATSGRRIHAAEPAAQILPPVTVINAGRGRQ